jgi:hypothetical protein
MAHELVLLRAELKDVRAANEYLVSAGELKTHVYDKEDHLVSKKLRT